MTARCLWCNRSEGTLKTIAVPARNRFGFGSRTLTVYVHPEHEQACRAACKRLYRCVPGLAIVTLEVLLLTAAFLIGLVTKALGTIERPARARSADNAARRGILPVSSCHAGDCPRLWAADFHATGKMGRRNDRCPWDGNCDSRVGDVRTFLLDFTKSKKGAELWL